MYWKQNCNDNEFWKKEFLPKILPKRDHPRVIKQALARGERNPSSATRKKELLTQKTTYSNGEQKWQAQQLNVLGSSLLSSQDTTLWWKSMLQQPWNERPRFLVPGQGGRKLLTVERFGIELATMVKPWGKNCWLMFKQQTFGNNTSLLCIWDELTRNKTNKKTINNKCKWQCRR